MQMHHTHKITLNRIVVIIILIFPYATFASKVTNALTEKKNEYFIAKSFQKKIEPKMIYLNDFLEKYGEYFEKENLLNDVFITKTSTDSRSAYINITIVQGCFIEKPTLQLFFQHKPLKTLPIHVNKYHQNIKFYHFKKPELKSYFRIEKIYGNSIKIRFPLKYVLKNQLSFSYAGDCYNRKKHDRQYRRYATRDVIYDAKSKKLKLVIPEESKHFEDF